MSESYPAGETDEGLKAWQNSVVEHAKAKLLRDGELVPLVYVLAKTKDVYGFVNRKNHRAYDFEMRPRHDEEDLDAPSCIVIPLLFSDQARAAMIRHYIIGKEKFDETWNELKQAGDRMGLSRDRQIHHFCNAMRGEPFHLDDVRIANHLIRDALKTTKAFAYLRVTEAYSVSRPNPSGSLKKPFEGEVKDQPDSLEAILSVLETPSWARLYTVPFVRLECDKGMVTDFKDAVAIDQKSHETRGRLFGLFKDLEGA